MSRVIKTAGLAPNGAGTRTTVSTTVIAPATVTGAVATDTSHFLVNVLTNGVYVTFDGTDPSGTNGHALPAGYQEYWTKQMAAKARWVRSGASDAAVHVSPFGAC